MTSAKGRCAALREATTHTIILYYRIIEYRVHGQFVLKLFIRNTEFYLLELCIYSKIERDKYETNSIRIK